MLNYVRALKDEIEVYLLEHPDPSKGRQEKVAEWIDLHAKSFHAEWDKSQERDKSPVS